MSSPHFSAPAFAKTCTVASSQVAADGSLTVPALLTALHECAQHHAAAHGLGYKNEDMHNRAWALVALDVVLAARPTGEQTYTTYTSVARAGGPLVWRDYVATTEAKAFATGQTMWALIDLTTRRTATVTPRMREVLTNATHGIQSTVSRVARLAVRVDLIAVEQCLVHPHDCDFNGHLNNVVAARWLLDAIYMLQAGYPPSYPAPSSDVPHPLSAFAKTTPDPLHANPTRLKLTYLQELLLGERVEVALLEEEGQWHAELRRHDGTVAVICMVELAAGVAG